MVLPVYYIDTFTALPFKGNPTAVCIPGKAIEASLMLAIANELNLPVTTFLFRSGDHHFNIHYFTPTTEIPACGHATLAAAKVAFALHTVQHVIFKTIENILIPAIGGNDSIVMTYPKYQLADTEISPALLRSLRLDNFKSAGFCKELESLFIELENPFVLRAVQPDYQAMVTARPEIKEVVITSVADTPEYDYLLRSFCPWIGINEDPVTGSVHAVLSGFWEKRLGKKQLKAYQASQRGGELFVQSFADKTELGGQSVLILKGEISC